MIVGVKRCTGQNDLRREQFLREGIVAGVAGTVGQDLTDGFIRQGRNAEHIRAVYHTVADHIGRIGAAAVLPQPVIDSRHLRKIAAGAVNIKIQPAVDRVGQNDRQKLAACPEVEAAQHTQHSRRSTARPHPRQLAYKQRAEKAAQQVERRDRQRLVVVHILHPGDKQHRQDCTDRRQYREGARLLFIQSV